MGLLAVATDAISKNHQLLFFTSRPQSTNDFRIVTNIACELHFNIIHSWALYRYKILHIPQQLCCAVVELANFYRSILHEAKMNCFSNLGYDLNISEMGPGHWVNHWRHATWYSVRTSIMHEIFTITSILPATPRSWWRHEMENFFRVTGPLCGEFTGHGEFPTWRPMTRGSGVLFSLHMNRRLSRELWCRWIEMWSRSLWRRCNVFPHIIYC